MCIRHWWLCWLYAQQQVINCLIETNPTLSICGSHLYAIDAEDLAQNTVSFAHGLNDALLILLGLYDVVILSPFGVEPLYQVI